MNRGRFRFRVLALVCLPGVVSAGPAAGQFPQEGEKDFGAKLKAAVDNIKPLPLTAIPDDPPPHEGALIDLPYTAEPPDLLIIEVLEALPGQPISGERLIRPDGTVSLGFYGTLHVRGLTLEQIKVKVVEHLRQYLADDTLGLREVVFPEGSGPAEGAKPGPVPPREPSGGEGGRGAEPPRGKAEPPSQGEGHRPARFQPPAGSRPRTTFRATSRQTRPVSDQPGERVSSPPPSLNIPVNAGAEVKITIEVQPAGPGTEARPGKMDPVVPPPARGVPVDGPDMGEEPFVTRPVAPADSTRVFVDVSAHNSKFYFVQGDVAVPGKMPFTGQETVLDAINLAGGLIPTADPADIRLVRPARGGKPGKVYQVDLKAITSRGDSRQNYQLFPGDRLVVGRDRQVQSTIQIDRLAASLQTVVNSSLQVSFMWRSLVAATPDLTPAQREAVLKEWFDAIWKAANQSGGPTPDEATYRELLFRLFKANPAPATQPEKK